MTRTIRWSLALAAATASRCRCSAQGAPAGDRGAAVREHRLLRPGQGVLRGARGRAASDSRRRRSPRILAPGSRITRECAEALDQQKLGAARRLDAASATAGGQGGRRALRHHRQLRRFLRQVSHQRAGRGRADRANPEGRLQRRSEAAGPRPARARSSSWWRDRIVAAVGPRSYPADSRRGAGRVPTEALTDFSRGLLYRGSRRPYQGRRGLSAGAHRRPRLDEARDGLQRVRAG